MILSQVGFSRRKGKPLKKLFPLSLRDSLLTAMILGLAALLCVLLRIIDGTSGDSYVSLVFLLAVFLISRFTTGYFYGTFASLFSVLAINYLFTYPYMAFNFTLAGYPLTILCTLAVAIITGTLTTRVKEQERIRSENEKERLRSNLLRSVSHDFRTPLTSIIGGTSALLENDDSFSQEQRIRLLKGVQEDARWLLRIVENLLSITRMEQSSGSIKIDLRPEPVEELVEDTVIKFRRIHPEWNLHVILPDDFLLVSVDPLLIEQVLLNLLENSLRHGKSATHTTLTVRNDSTHAIFEVEDDGCGIDEKLLPHLFEGKGFSAEGTNDKQRNMGIGLSVCRAIIKAHHGTLTAENAASGGALFRFTLPMED
ncbi:MAG: DUF4118 domain-containing protein [Clostridiales bacterium]|nr:DUF4118 domain-containing protein [Clostridiales bacterium]